MNATNCRPMPDPSQANHEDRFLINTRLMAETARELEIELRLDAEAVAMGEELSLAQIAAMGRRVGHYGLTLLSLLDRICLKCDSPLYSPNDRLSGFCELCRMERQARIAKAIADRDEYVSRLERQS